MRRMSNIQKEKYLLQLLAYRNNYKQKVSLLKNLNKIQYNVLKEIVSNILSEVIPLTVKQFYKLLHYKNFIRQLGRNKVDKNKLVHNYSAVVELTEIALNYNEICSETSTGSSRRMGKNKIKRCPSETSISECSSSEGRAISTSENMDTNTSEGIRENSTKENSRGGIEVIDQLLTPKQEW